MATVSAACDADIDMGRLSKIHALADGWLVATNTDGTHVAYAPQTVVDSIGLVAVDVDSVDVATVRAAIRVWW